MTGKFLTVAVPAYCEGDNLNATVQDILDAGRKELDGFEFVIVNDGSTDQTGDVADEICKLNDIVSVIHFEKNKGVGAAYKAALDRAIYPNFTLVPGDRAFEKSGLHTLFQVVGTVDMVVSYRANPLARTPVRRLLSRICTRLLGVATRCNLKDGHSLYVWPVEMTREIKAPSDYCYHLVTLVELLSRVETYMEVPVMLTQKPDFNSGVMRFGVVSRLAWSMAKTLWKSFFRNRFKSPPRRI